MSEPKPLIESEDSKMKSFIKRIKPKKMNIFKTKFFGKNKDNTKNTYISYDELIDEESKIFEYQDYNLEESTSVLTLTNDIKKITDSDQMSLIETEESKMESVIKRIKPNKIDIFKRMKRSTTKFFGTNISYDELIDEKSKIFEYRDYDLETKLYLPWPCMPY